MDNVHRVRSDATSSEDLAGSPPGSPSKRSFCKTKFFIHACSNAGLAILVVVYTLFGAVLFELVEGGADQGGGKDSRQMQRGGGVMVPSASGGIEDKMFSKNREECLRELWTITERLNVLYERNWTRLVHEQLQKFEHNLIVAAQNKGHLEILGSQSQEQESIAQNNWSFGSALLYSVTIITTIGYGNLAPRTALGKVLTMVYAAFGVPLMLLCLSSLGQLLAKGVHFTYVRLSCSQNMLKRSKEESLPSEGHGGYSHRYQRAPTSPGRSSFAGTHDTSLIQLSTPQKIPSIPSSPLHPQQLINVHQSPLHLQHTPRKSLLATVNTSHTRGRCRLLSERPTSTSSSPARGLGLPPLECAAHAPLRSEMDIVDPDETDDNDSGLFPHGTPSRIPLIWRGDSTGTMDPQDIPHHTTVPVGVVLLVLSAYLCLGAFIFSAWENWSYLDATYFCFITLSTIGFGDLIPGRTLPTEYGHFQLLACSAYLVLGLVLVAMSFSLIHDGVINKCKQFARVFGGN